MHCDECMDNYLYIKIDDQFSNQEIDSMVYLNNRYKDTQRLVEMDRYHNGKLEVLLYEQKDASSFALINPLENRQYDFDYLYYKKGESEGCCDCGEVDYIKFNFNDLEQLVQGMDTFILMR